MRFTATVLLCVSMAALPKMIKADWTIWEQNCAQALDGGDSFTSWNAATNAQGACDGAVSDDDSASTFTSGNPCNIGGDDTLTYVHQGDGSLIVSARGNQVGTCSPSNSDVVTCNYEATSCACNIDYVCYSSYCT